MAEGPASDRSESHGVSAALDDVCDGVPFVAGYMTI